MKTAAEILAGLARGDVPFSFTLAGEPARFTFSHQRTVRRMENRRDFVYRVEGAPITVVVETTFLAERDFLTYSVRLVAEKSVAQLISSVRILDLAGLDATSLRGWEGGNSHERDENGETYRRQTIPPLLHKMWDREIDAEEIFYENLDGRSSCTLLPVWFVYNQDGGLWFGPEWSGTWSMATGRNDAGAYAWCALPILDFRMLQGEEVQLPPVSLGDYEGGVNDGCVKLRGIIRDEFLPTISGKKPLPPVCCHAIGGSLPHFDAAGLQVEMDVCAALGIEQFAFASCWYRPPKGTKTPFAKDELLGEMFPRFQSVEAYEIVAWWEKCGPFEPHPDRFPRGLKAFAEELEARGILLGLWYDPRINVLTETYEPWQDGLTPYHSIEPNDKAWDLGLIDMGRETGRQLMFEILERFIVEYGAKYLWHDMNVPPRFRYWEQVEEEGRKGLTELRHYLGSNQVYDRLLREHPDVWIEWCGSGGTMINLGVLRRAHTLHIADFCGIKDADKPNADAWRDMRTSLNWILPTTCINNHFGPPGGMYEKAEGMGLDIFLTSFGSAMNLHQTISHWSDRDRADAATAIGIFKNVRKYTLGEFWSLFPQPRDHTGWDGWQFHDPQTGTGIVLLFKRRDCEENHQEITLRWPDDPQNLRFAAMIGEATTQWTNGKLHVNMPAKAALIRYDRCTQAGTEKREFPDE